MSGLLNTKVGGPSVFPDLPTGWPRRAAAGSSRAPDERNRRSVYIFVRRNSRYPMLEAFDMPDTHESCPRRDVTTTAPQALTLLNDKRRAGVGAGLRRTRARRRADPVDRAFRLAYSRPPDQLGEGHGRDLPRTSRSRSLRSGCEGREMRAAAPAARRLDPAYAAALVDFCQMLLNSNEFVYRN